MFKHITHLIYDLDGLLLDTERVYTEAAAAVCEKYGRIFDITLKPKLIGRPALESASDLIRWMDLPLTPQAFLNERKVILETHLPYAQPMPGALAFTQTCKRRGIPQAIATSSDSRLFELKTSQHRTWLDTVFDSIVTSDHPDVKKGKPAPDVFLVAAHLLHAAPHQCLVFEDSPAGVEAALAAGMQVVAIPDSAYDKILFQNATLILDSFETFKQGWLLP